MSFAVNHLIGFGARRAVANPTISYTASGEDNTDGTSKSVTSLSIGAAASNRKIIAGLMMAGGGAYSISSITIGGVSATAIVSPTYTSNHGTAIYIADVPTGTTADVAVTFSGSIVRFVVSLFRVVDLNSSTAYATATDTTISSGTFSANIDVPANGFAVAVATGSNGTAAAWTNLTERYDSNPEGQMNVSSASESFVAAQSSLAVSVTQTSATAGTMSVASWGN